MDLRCLLHSAALQQALKSMTVCRGPWTMLDTSRMILIFYHLWKESTMMMRGLKRMTGNKKSIIIMMLDVFHNPIVHSMLPLHKFTCLLQICNAL
jgi:hypothetical protein